MILLHFPDQGYVIQTQKSGDPELLGLVTPPSYYCLEPHILCALGPLVYLCLTPLLLLGHMRLP